MAKRTFIKIGRLSTNQVVINDPAIADVHLELFADAEGNVFITDLGSPQGTSVNGKRLKGYALLSKGDDVILGGKFRFNWEKYRIKNTASASSSARKPALTPDNNKKEELQEKPKNPSGERIKIFRKEPSKAPSDAGNSEGGPVKLKVSWVVIALIYAAIFTFLYLIYRIN
jgi:pSer/pThr/pTyr-binding forkhead associated (FHA) protein